MAARKANKIPTLISEPTYLVDNITYPINDPVELNETAIAKDNNIYIYTEEYGWRLFLFEMEL